MRPFRTSPLLLGAIVTCAAPSIRAALVYDNTTTTQFNSFGTLNPDTVTFGDYVTLASGPTTITEITFLIDANQDSGAPEADLGLYVYADIAGTVGNLLGSAMLNGYVFSGNGTSPVVFTGLNIPVGTTAFVGLSIGNYNGDDTFDDFIGVEMYDPPTVGSSDADTMVVAFGAGLGFGQGPAPALGPGLNNIAMTIVDVPEPQAYALLGGLGLVGFTLWRRRHSR